MTHCPAELSGYPSSSAMVSYCVMMVWLKRSIRIINTDTMLKLVQQVFRLHKNNARLYKLKIHRIYFILRKHQLPMTTITFYRFICRFHWSITKNPFCNLGSELKHDRFVLIICRHKIMICDSKKSKIEAISYVYNNMKQNYCLV